MGYSPWGHKELDTTERLTHTHTQLLYSVGLVFAIQQSESGIHTHISPLFWISFPFRLPWSTE